MKVEISDEEYGNIGCEVSKGGIKNYQHSHKELLFLWIDIVPSCQKLAIV